MSVENKRRNGFLFWYARKLHLKEIRRSKGSVLKTVSFINKGAKSNNGVNSQRRSLK